jgi:Oxidoreductase family, NAD-binding Rossmann fold
MAARREFIKATVLGAAGLGLGATTARGQSRVLGANDRVVLASIGIRGQGNALKRGFAGLKGVEIKTLCDIDENLFAERANDPKLKDVATFRPRYEKDLRRVFDDKDVDAVLVATPNHWHALAAIWGLQAGKHVFVEKPASHTVWEGRQMVEAQKKYKKLVQVGTMNRSRPPVIAAIKFMQDGGLGKLYMARGLCFKPRPSIGRYPDGPLPPGEKYRLNVESKEYEPTWDAAYLAKVDYDLWQGPAPSRPFNRNRFHYNLH